MGWRSTTGGWPKRGGCCRASSSTPRRCAAPSGGFSGGGSPADSRPASSRRSPNRSWVRCGRCIIMADHVGQGRGGEFTAGRTRPSRSGGCWARWNCSARAKIELGSMLLDSIRKRKMEAARPAIAWAVGRLGPLPALRPAQYGHARRRDCPLAEETHGNRPR